MQNPLRHQSIPSLELVTDQNQFLASLSSASRERIARNLELVSLKLGEAVCRAGDAEHFTYFPNDCILSVLHVLQDGRSAELFAVGNDGILGTTALLGEDKSWIDATVQSAGSAFRMPVSLLREELRQHSEIGRTMLIYMESAMHKIALAAACGRHHTIEQQVCRKLLATLDRLAGNELTLTQEVIGTSLGVRRESVTAVASALRELGAIDYSRGRIKVLDRSKLEELVCECYALSSARQHRLRLCHGPARAVPVPACRAERPNPRYTDRLASA